MDPLSVLVTRGDVVEAVHRVHALTTDGCSFGDPRLTCFLRSSAKPIQAIPLVESYDDLADQEIAIACASHQAEPEQLDAVRMLLARAGATVDDLENGVQEGSENVRLANSCSGKHAGTFTPCRATAWPLDVSGLPDHPLQRRIRELIGGDG